MSNLLSWIVFLPAIGALVCLFAPKRQIKVVAVLTTFVTMLVSLLLFQTFFAGGTDPASVFGTRYGALHHIERISWISLPGKLNIEYFLGIDGLGFPLVILTTFVSFLSCLASWNFEHWKNNKGIRAYFILFLLLETGMLGVFVSLDFFLFYIFWEVMLLPMYFLIGVWGGPRKEYAAIKFFLFTLGGSVLMLVALVAMYFYSGAAIANAGGAVGSGYQQGVTLSHGTFDLIELATNPAIQSYFKSATTLFMGLPFATIMFVFLFVGFAVKLPAVPRAHLVARRTCRSTDSD